MNVGAVILAAGSSSRYGQPKQLLVYRNQTLVRRVAVVALDAGCRPVAVVVGREGREIANELHDLDVMILPNELWKRGLGTSIRVGVEALKDCDALLILVCDQPHLSASLVRELIARHEERLQPMVAAAYAGTLGVPALFARTCFHQLLSLGDEQGAKALLTAQPNDVAEVAFPAGAVDLDTPDDWAEFQLQK